MAVAIDPSVDGVKILHPVFYNLILCLVRQPYCAASSQASSLTSEMAKSESSDSTTGYFMDSLFRGSANVSSTQQTNAVSLSEVGRIFMYSIRTGPLPAEDLRYVAAVVAQRSGLTQQEAAQRVNDTYRRLQTKLRDVETSARDTADKARKASAYAALWIFVSLLMGAFAASLAATIGGRQRDL